MKPFKLAVWLDFESFKQGCYKQYKSTEELY